MPSLLNGYLTPLECAEQLGIARRTLERWWRLREGPPRLKIGRRIFYRRDAVADWLLTRECDSAT